MPRWPKVLTHPTGWLFPQALMERSRYQAHYYEGKRVSLCGNHAYDAERLGIAVNGVKCGRCEAVLRQRGSSEGLSLVLKARVK